jgi:FtsZ-binding cell division protein ZapB
MTGERPTLEEEIKKDILQDRQRIAAQAKAFIGQFYDLTSTTDLDEFLDDECYQFDIESEGRRFCETFHVNLQLWEFTGQDDPPVKPMAFVHINDDWRTFNILNYTLDMHKDRPHCSFIHDIQRASNRCFCDRCNHIVCKYDPRNVPTTPHKNHLRVCVGESQAKYDIMEPELRACFLRQYKFLIYPDVHVDAIPPQQTIAQLTQTITQLTQTIDDVREENHQLKQTVTQLTQTIDDVREENHQLRQDFERLQRNVKGMQRNFDLSVEAELTTNEQIVELTKRIPALERK